MVENITVRELIARSVDIDVYDDTTEDLAVAFCGPQSLTAAGQEHFSRALDLSVVLHTDEPGYPDHAVVILSAYDGEWQKDLRAASDLFYGAAGYCSIDDYDKWFSPDPQERPRYFISRDDGEVYSLADLRREWERCHVVGQTFWQKLHELLEIPWWDGGIDEIDPELKLDGLGAHVLELIRASYPQELDKLEELIAIYCHDDEATRHKLDDQIKLRCYLLNH